MRSGIAEGNAAPTTDRERGKRSRRFDDIKR
jgi:hypothetical protein